MTLDKLCLKKEEDRRILSGHLWIYSNEVATHQSPLRNFTPGQQVRVQAHNGKMLGIAYVNPNSLICGRILTTDPHEEINHEFLVSKFQRALSLREQIFDKPYYRLVFAESDYLPGLIVDRFGDEYVVQMNTAGMEMMKEKIITALDAVVKPKSVLLRNDSSRRELEGLETYKEAVIGTPAPHVKLIENNCQFMAAIWEGQKTGWFYDHRLNRAALKTFVKDKKVLDVFSYSGAFAIPAAVFGAAHVTSIDSSEVALTLLHENAGLNKVDARMTTIKSDAFDAMNQLINDKQKFDVIVLDPPAFIKRKKDIESGKIAYQRINELALKILNKDGILISASCSMHLHHEDLINVLRKASHKTGRSLQIISQGHQGPDHPIHLMIDETEYLKAFVVRAL